VRTACVGLLALTASFLGSGTLRAQATGEAPGPTTAPAASVADATPETATPNEGPAPTAPEDVPTLTASADTTDVAVGERIRLAVDVRELGAWTVTSPPTTLDLDAFRLRAVERAPSEGGERLVLTLVALRAGDHEIPPIPLAIRRGTETGEIATAPVPVRVRSNLAAETDSAGVAAEPSLAPFKPALDAKRNWIPVVVAVVVTALAAVLGFWLLRKLRRRPAPVEAVAPTPKRPLRPAWELALERLDRIAAADYVSRGELLRQYVEVTEALRQYLEDRYGVPALESTTEELNERLRGTPLPPELAARSLSLLREADLVKFAKGRPAPGDASSSQTRVRAIVTATIPAPEVSS
jgi:hypothetical protein